MDGPRSPRAFASFRQFVDAAIYPALWRAATGLEADDTARQLRKEIQNFAASQLSANDLAVLGDPVDLEPALRFSKRAAPTKTNTGH